MSTRCGYTRCVSKRMFTLSMDMARVMSHIMHDACDVLAWHVFVLELFISMPCFTFLCIHSLVWMIRVVSTEKFH